MAASSASFACGYSNKHRKKECPPESKSLYRGEFHYKCHNFTGPGTNYTARVKRGDKPLNEIDKCSMVHDKAYVDIDTHGRTLTKRERAKRVHVADAEVLKCYERHKHADGFKFAHSAIRAKHKTELYLSKKKGYPVALYGSNPVRSTRRSSRSRPRSGGRRSTSQASPLMREYRAFVKKYFHRLQGTPQERMKRLSLGWKKHKRERLSSR